MLGWGIWGSRVSLRAVVGSLGPLCFSLSCPGVSVSSWISGVTLWASLTGGILGSLSWPGVSVFSWLSGPGGVSGASRVSL